MKVLKYILLFCTLSFGQNDYSELKDLNCGVFLSPIGGLDLSIGLEKEKTLRLFEENNFFKNLSDDKNCYYKVSRAITLPNKKASKLYGTLAFNKKNELVYFELSLSFGGDYNYFNDLLLILKTEDSLKINQFVYKCSNIICVEENKNCHKIFSRRRNPLNFKDFEINIKYSKTQND